MSKTKPKISSINIGISEKDRKKVAERIRALDIRLPVPARSSLH